MLRLPAAPRPIVPLETPRTRTENVRRAVRDRVRVPLAARSTRYVDPMVIGARRDKAIRLSINGGVGVRWATLVGHLAQGSNRALAQAFVDEGAHIGHEQIGRWRRAQAMPSPPWAARLLCMARAMLTAAELAECGVTTEEADG